MEMYAPLRGRLDLIDNSWHLLLQPVLGGGRGYVLQRAAVVFRGAGLAA